MRPPPVHFPAGHCGGGPTQKFGRCVAVLRLVWSLHAAATSATTAPAPRVVSNLRFLSLHMTFTSASGGFADADPRLPNANGMPPCGAPHVVARAGVNDSVAGSHQWRRNSFLLQRGARVHQTTRRDRATKRPGWNPGPTRRRGERRAVRSPRSAGRSSNHHLLGSDTDTAVTVTAIPTPSSMARRSHRTTATGSNHNGWLRESDGATRLARGRSRTRLRLVGVVAHTVAHHPCDPLRGPSVPALNQGPGGRAPAPCARGRCEDGVAAGATNRLVPCRQA